MVERVSSVNTSEHLRLTEASQVSFVSKGNAKRFREWLLGPFPEVRPTSLGLEVLGFLAKETVAAVVDVALLVRSQRHRPDPTTPLLRLRAPDPDNRHSHTTSPPPRAERGRWRWESGREFRTTASVETSFLLAKKIRERASGRAYLEGVGIDVLASETLSPDDVREAQRRLLLAAAPDPFRHATTPQHWLPNLTR